MTRTVCTVLGLAAGLAILAAAGPASAIHIELMATGTTAVGEVVPDPIEGVTATTPAIVELNEPLSLSGLITDDTGSGVPFTHTYNFGFEVAGPGTVSATPNVLPSPTGGFAAGFAEFDASVTGPGITGSISLTPLAPPFQATIAAFFAATNTGATTPYVLTVTGRLLEGVTAAIYSGNVSVVPLPGAAALFLTALGGLAFARRYRRREEEGMAAAA